MDKSLHNNLTFQHKLFRKIPVKTNKTYLNIAEIELLEKRDFNLSGDTNQEANRKLKTIATLAGISTLVQEGEHSGPKSLFVTTHTARRSAATNLALQGVNLKIISDLGGWEDVQTLRTYLRASGIESAVVAKDLEFFR